MAKLLQLPGASPADEGEALVVQHLRETLPDTYTLIPNVEIAQKGRPRFEYDLIVVAPHAVYVVEIKRWRGGIRGDDYVWWVADRHRRQNPLPTANNKARVLKSQIQNKQPACDPLWVEAVIAIADEQSELDLHGNCRERVFRYTDLPDFLRDATALGDKAGDLRSARAYIEKAIQESATGRQNGPLRFGDYEAIETLSRRDQVAEYQARSTLLRGEETVRLRVFSYDPYLAEDELARRQEVIRREAESLQRIGPHPNLIGLKAFTTVPEDPNLFMEVTEWSEEGALRALMSAQTPLSLERKLELAQGIAAGLKAAHDAGVIHRDVRPENVLIGRDGQPRLMNFDHARLTLPHTRTISPMRPEPDVPRAYMAPELLDPTRTPTPATDLYGLGTVLFELLTGEPLYATPEAAREANTSAGGPAAFGIADVPVRLNELVRRMSHPDPTKRPQRADEVLDELRLIREKPSGTVAEAEAPAGDKEPVPIPLKELEPAIFAIDNLIDGKYQVQKVLDAGGSGRVYRVYDGVFDCVYALKVLNDTSLAEQFLRMEARALLDVSHPHIVKVRTWGRLPQTGRLYLVSDFVEGEDLTHYTAPDRRLSVNQAVEAILDLLEALEALHPDVDRIEALRQKMTEGEIAEEEYEEFQRLQSEGWLHRDVKPANLMLTASGLVLVDFNIAARASEAGHTIAGTPGYMLPDVGIMRWNPDADLFATGIVLYELLTGHHPYPDGQPSAEDEPTDPLKYVPNLRPDFAQLLRHAVSCDPAVRYHSARRLRQDLLALDGVYLSSTQPAPAPGELALADWECGKPDYNPHVTRFLTLYSQAQRDNSGTRGLDEVARLTYVETRLDRLLAPAVLDGRYRLVIITGNAGDGKTAFIKQLEASVAREGVQVQQVTPNSSRFIYCGRQFVTNYDGSQDEGAEQANDQVLTEFFAPFDDNHFGAPGAAASVHLIAINEGRLIDFLGQSLAENDEEQASNAAFPFRRLGQTINRFFESKQSAGLPDWLLIVDLNRRSVVALDTGWDGKSIFDRQLDALLKPAFWIPCQVCSWRQTCFIKFNVDTLADPTSGPAVRERLRTLFEIVHLRRQLHITMRDMRSALSWLLFRDHTCDDIARLAERHLSPQEQLNLLYHNAYASDGQPPEGNRDDRLVQLLRQIDPAESANPEADRSLYFRSSDGLPMLAFEERASLASDRFQAWELPTGWEGTRNAHVVRQHRTRHLVVRRQAFFERRDEGWWSMLPYQNLALFQEVTGAEGKILDTLREQLKTALVEGISRAQGARHLGLATRFVCLRAGDTEKASIKSFRMFPISDFAVEVPHWNGSLYL